jgi:hypothetical protein
MIPKFRPRQQMVARSLRPRPLSAPSTPRWPGERLRPPVGCSKKWGEPTLAPYRRDQRCVSRSAPCEPRRSPAIALDGRSGLPHQVAANGLQNAGGSVRLPLKFLSVIQCVTQSLDMYPQFSPQTCTDFSRPTANIGDQSAARSLYGDVRSEVVKLCCLSRWREEEPGSNILR